MPRAEAVVNVGDRGFLYGDGIFETMLMRGDALPLLSLHLARMEASARFLSIPFDPEHARRACLTLAEAMAAQSGAAPEHVIRLTLTRGPAGKRGYQPPPDPTPTLMVAASPYQRPTGPLSAITASFRIHEGSPLVAHKSLSALEKVLAKSEAARTGCDEALLLNLAGRIAEGAATNLFIVRQGLWMTPPLSDGCLPGIMRQRILNLTGGLEWKLTPADLFRCDGVYLTNAVQGCLPLAALDGRGLPWGSPPSFLHRLWTL
ncbi:MAG TPA: aminotransferase class IV [Symbiobacteriaceae bacterium]|jgi:branched-chain amino acid aminotransferase|nr:aminotransferase class IV [Symbiobacteriaceae bacterium]